MAELARRIAKHDSFHLGTTGAQQIRRWEAGQRPRYEAETIAAIAVVTGRPISFFYETGDERGGAASDDEEAAQVSVTTVTTTYTGRADLIADLIAQAQATVGGSHGEARGGRPSASYIAEPRGTTVSAGAVAAASTPRGGMR